MGHRGWMLVILGLAGMVSGQGPEPGSDPRRTGNLCANDLECPVNAFCKSSAFCVCKDGYIFTTVNSTYRGCILSREFEQDCFLDVQCQINLGVHSECKNEVCSCKDDSHFENSYCYVNAKVGERCLTHNNCFLADKLTGDDRNVWCVRGYCTCGLSHSPRDNGTRCVQDAQLGDPCEDQEQCAGPGLECRGTCQCRGHYVANWNLKKCVERVSNLGEPCDFDVQCNSLSGTKDAPQPGAALCLVGTCQCAYNARAAGLPARCWFRRRPGQECMRDEECVSEEDEPGYCLKGRCTCKTCAPDARDFSVASAMCPPKLLAAAIFVAAILAY